MYILDRVSKVFAGRTIAVHELDLKVRKGERVAFIGRVEPARPRCSEC